MTSGLIVILAALVPFILNVISAKIAKDATPQAQIDELNTQIDKIIATHDSTAATLLVNQLLSRLPNQTVSGNTK